MNYAFPGNIRELKAVIELGCILSNGLVIETDHLNMVEKEIVFNLTESEKP